MFRPNQNKSAAPLIAQSQITCARHFSNLPGFPKEGKENGGGDVTKLPTTTGMANLGFFIGSQPKLWKIKTYENELHHFNDPERPVQIRHPSQLPSLGLWNRELNLHSELHLSEWLCPKEGCMGSLEGEGRDPSKIGGGGHSPPAVRDLKIFGSWAGHRAR